MGYPLADDAQANILNAILGRQSTIPTSWEIALLNGHPLDGGTELAGTGGYVRPVVTNNTTLWPGWSGGQTVSALITCADPTGPWSDIATHYLLIDHADSVTQYFPGRLLGEIAVNAAGSGPKFQMAAFWNTSAR